MDKVLGKYLNQPDNDFHRDCKTFDYIQNVHLKHPMWILYFIT